MKLLKLLIVEIEITFVNRIAIIIILFVETS